MSPIGGVGINLAIQDAVAAANILAGPMARGEDVAPLLAKVQARRMLPTRLTQAMQEVIQNRVIAPLLDDDTAFDRPRSEEHTSELQSLMRISYAVFCLKKKNKKTRE